MISRRRHATVNVDPELGLSMYKYKNYCFLVPVN
jgi:hypothetical protein